MTPRNSLERKILERARNIGPGEEANIYAEAEEFGVRLDEVDSRRIVFATPGTSAWDCWGERGAVYRPAD